MLNSYTFSLFIRAIDSRLRGNDSVGEVILSIKNFVRWVYPPWLQAKTPTLWWVNPPYGFILNNLT